MSVAVAEPKPKPEKFFTRWEHGSIPVTRNQDKWVLHHPEGEREFSSGRALMRAIHNGRDPHLQVERYFKAGRWSKKSTAPNTQSGTVIEFKKPTAHPTTLELFGIKDSKIVASLVKPEIKPDIKSNTKPSTSQLGIDLVNRSHEVKKLLYAGFGSRIVAMGYDPEDVLQDVYKGLLARNNGKCPWDASKSSFGHYVYMVCGCILSNYHRKYNRINQNERSGVYMMRDGSSCEVDLAESNLCIERESQGDAIDEDEMVDELYGAISSTMGDVVLEDGIYCKREVSLRVLPLLVLGWKRREISHELGIREGIITKCINFIRKIARDTWNVAPMWA